MEEQYEAIVKIINRVLETNLATATGHVVTLHNMSDVNWRYIEFDKSIFLPENSNKDIIVLTNKGLVRETKAKYVDSDYFMKCCQEIVMLYAYLY